MKTFVKSLGATRAYDRARWAGRKKKARELKKELRDVKGDIVLLLNAGTL